MYLCVASRSNVDYRHHSPKGPAGPYSIQRRRLPPSRLRHRLRNAAGLAGTRYRADLVTVTWDNLGATWSGRLSHIEVGFTLAGYYLFHPVRASRAASRSQASRSGRAPSAATHLSAWPFTTAPFAAEHVGVYVASHGSWNKGTRTGYKIIRVPRNNGVPTGEYQDFVTGFVTADGQVWGRPVGVAVAADGSLMVSDDGTNSIWQVRYTGK